MCNMTHAEALEIARRWAAEGSPRPWAYTATYGAGVSSPVAKSGEDVVLEAEYWFNEDMHPSETEAHANARQACLDALPLAEALAWQLETPEKHHWACRQAIHGKPCGCGVQALAGFTATVERLSDA